VKPEELISNPTPLNETSASLELIEKTREANELFDLEPMLQLFYWPPAFTKESWSKLQEKHKEISIGHEKER
jgi:hypothetical protein